MANHLSDWKATDAATARAVKTLADSEARAKLAGPVLDAAATRLAHRIRSSREKVAAAFAPAVEPYLDTLNTDAAKLPTAFAPDQAGNLPEHLYGVWHTLRDAHRALDALRGPLDKVYPSQAGPFLGRDALAALRWVAPPADIDEVEAAHAFADALLGQRRAGGQFGQLHFTPTFATTAIAHAGGTFAWGTAADVARRAALLSKAATPRKVDRTGTWIVV